MFLSYLLVDTGNSPNKTGWNLSRRWLGNVYRVHQRLAMAFPSGSRKESDSAFLKPYAPTDFRNQVHVTRDNGQGFLFRVDPLGGGRVVILVQSALPPDWDYAFHNARYLLAAQPECKPLTLRFEKGERYRFRLLANPTRRLSKNSLGPDGKKVQKGIGKRVPVPTADLADWLIRRSEAHGFEVAKGSLSLAPGYVYFKKDDTQQRRRLRSCRYDGELMVIDPDSLWRAVVSGIGPAKGLGFGLLSLARCRP